MSAEPVLDYSTARPADPSPATLRQVAVVACKLLAVWLLAGSALPVVAVVVELVYAVGLAVAGRSPPRFDLGPWMTGGLLTLAPAAAAAAVWWAAGPIARRMVPDDRPVAWPGRAADLLPVGLAVAGVIVAVDAARGLARTVAYMAHEHPYGGWWQDTVWTDQFWSSAVGLAAAAWLIFGGRGLARLVAMARSPDKPRAAGVLPSSTDN